MLLLLLLNLRKANSARCLVASWPVNSSNLLLLLLLLFFVSIESTLDSFVLLLLLLLLSMVAVPFSFVRTNSLKGLENNNNNNNINNNNNNIQFLLYLPCT